MTEDQAMIRVRVGTAADADALATLSGQLGYPSTLAQIAARFAALATRPDWAAYVAELDGRSSAACLSMPCSVCSATRVRRSAA